MELLGTVKTVTCAFDLFLTLFQIRFGIPELLRQRFFFEDAQLRFFDFEFCRQFSDRRIRRDCSGFIGAGVKFRNHFPLFDVVAGPEVEFLDMGVHMPHELEGVFGDNDAVRIDGIFDLEQEQREQRGEDRHGSHDCKDDEYPDFRTQI